jgi:hypothetical protein
LISSFNPADSANGYFFKDNQYSFFALRTAQIAGIAGAVYVAYRCLCGEKKKEQKEEDKNDAVVPTNEQQSITSN